MIEEKIMDYSLSSIDDYTIECKIDSEFYHEVIKMTKDAQPISEQKEEVPIRRFQSYLTQEIQSQLASKNKSQDIDEQEFHVADMTFSFNNKQMLKLLLNRAKYLQSANIDKAKEVEAKMTQLKNEKLEQLVVPTSLFCTFMKVRGKNSATENNFEFKLDASLDKHYTIEASRARSPSDILWLNQGEPIRKRRCLIAIISGIALTLAWIVGFLFITEIGMQMYINYIKDPPISFCYQLLKQKEFEISQLRFDSTQRLAEYEYLFFHSFDSFRENSRDLEKRIPKIGALSCFCRYQD